MRSRLPHAGQRVEQPGNRRRNLRHVEPGTNRRRNLRHAERRAEREINRKRTLPHAVQHAAPVISLLRVEQHVEPETNRFCITWNRIPAEEPPERGEEHPGGPDFIIDHCQIIRRSTSVQTDRAGVNVFCLTESEEDSMRQYFSFQWHITDECDQRCKHCYIFSEDNCKKLDSMTWEQMQKTFDNCLDFCRTYDRLPYFYITGGDPILHPDFWRLLELLKSHDIPFTILGNPFHLNDEVCQKLKGYGCEKYQLSLDGMRKTHDWFRKPGSFDITLEKIKCIRMAGIRAVIMTTVSGTNIDEIPDIIDTVVEHKADVFAFARYCPTSEEKDVGIEPMRYRQLLADCDRKFKEYEAAGCETYFNKKDHLWTLYEYETGEFKIPQNAEEGMIYGGCNCGNCHLTILPTGDIYACRRVQNSKAGNVFTDRIADVWLGRMEQYRDYKKFEKCAKCELLARCRGCPAVASGKDGDFYAADPQCWKEVG